jgi:glycosyltransferase involved in cell wall biosynthesis
MESEYFATIVYADTLDVANWEARYRAGTVPSFWPYGLDLLRLSGAHLALASGAKSPRINIPSGRGVTFGFDERVARTVAASKTRRACGVIWLAEPSTSLKARLKKRLAIHHLSKMEVIWCYSSAMVDELVRILHVDRSRVRYVPLGIDHEFYSPQPYPEDEIVLSVGNDRSRDSRTLYEAMELIHLARPQTRFIVQSKDPYPAPAFVERVNQFADHADLRNNYASASLVMIATHSNFYTSGSTVALEVQSMARPVVITDTPGMDAYVHHGVSGYRAAPGDPGDMARLSLQILEDKVVGRKFGLAGRERIARANTTHEMAKVIDQNLKGLLEP